MGDAFGVERGANARRQIDLLRKESDPFPQYLLRAEVTDGQQQSVELTITVHLQLLGLTHLLLALSALVLSLSLLLLAICRVAM